MLSMEAPSPQKVRYVGTVHTTYRTYLPLPTIIEAKMVIYGTVPNGTVHTVSVRNRVSIIQKKIGKILTGTGTVYKCIGT